MTEPKSPYLAPKTAETPSEKGSNTKKMMIGLLALVVVAGIYWYFRDLLTFENLAAQEDRLRDLEAESPWFVIACAFGLYVLVSGLSLPGGAVALSLTYGSYFGWLRALVLVSFASTAGATVAFLFSRYLFRDAIQRRFAQQLAKINANLEKEGPFYLFTLRLIPLVPFFMLNLVMGLTQMRTWTFWWVSQIGMLAGTMAYIYAGSTLSVSELAEKGFEGLGWEVALAFAVLGIFPLASRKLMQRIKKKDHSNTPERK